jgi:HlyD family secretion protein
MDIARPDSYVRAKRNKRIAVIVGVVAVIVVVTLGLSQLQPAPPSVERATVWVDTVKRGEMLRQVRGLGTLVPEEIRWLPAETEGRVDQIILRPGAVVQADSVILVLSNPEVERQALDAELQFKAAEAQMANLRVQLESTLLNQRAQAANIQAEYHQARLQAEVDEQLANEGLGSKLNYKRSKVRAEEFALRHELEQKRLEIAADAVKAQLAVQQATVDQLKALAGLRKQQLDALRVRARMAGVLQLVPLDVGQQVAPGTNLARVANPARLKAEIRIPETQAKDVLIGQKAEIDTRNGIVAGRVTRIDPAVQQGTVLVDVSLEGDLPPGARPDLSVDGTVEIERLADVMYVGRPVQGQPNSQVGLFKLTEDGREAALTTVKLGRSSVSTIEVVDGLKVGDRVVLSDMSAWDAHKRIRLN